AHEDARAARQILLGRGDEPLDLGVDAGEVGVDDVAVDVDGRRDVVVRHRAGRGAPVDVGHVPQDLHRAAGGAGGLVGDGAGRVERDVRQVLQVVERVL